MSARPAITSLSLLLLLMACGGETPTEDFTPPPDESQSGSEDTEAASPWASLDTAALVALSRDRVAARIAVPPAPAPRITIRAEVRTRSARAP